MINMTYYCNALFSVTLSAAEVEQIKFYSYRTQFIDCFPNSTFIICFNSDISLFCECKNPTGLHLNIIYNQFHIDISYKVLIIYTSKLLC